MKKIENKEPEMKAIDQCINQAMINIHGEFCDKDVYDACSTKDLGITPERALELLLYTRIDNSKKIWKREKPNKNGSLFGEEYLERLLTKGDTNVKVGDATWHWHVTQEKDQLKALARSQSKIDVDNRRRSILGSVMAADESMTTREAAEHLGLFDEDEIANQ